MPTALLPPDLPSGLNLVAEGIAIGTDLTPGTNRLCREFGVTSEVAYKRQMAKAGRMTTAMNIGMRSFEETAVALRRIHEACEQRGFRIDRFQMNLDRRMGLPRQFWDSAAKETGPMLESQDDWAAVGEVVPIAPHMGDMMIGSPASVDSTCRAVEAGVDYIGNLSQFHWLYPGWPGSDIEQVAQTVTALGIMAARRDGDAMVHSYLDDGFAAQFQDYRSYLGWAMFERYVVNDLIGARLSVSYGGLTRDPAIKAAMILALESITPPGHMNAFYHGNTTAYAPMPDQNFAVMAIDMLYMVLARQRAGGGAAVLPVPVTEALRTPNWEEIVQIHTVARRLIDEAPAVSGTIDWEPLESVKVRLVDGGHQFFDRLLNGLAEGGVDINDPLQCLLSVRRLGARAIEARFGQTTSEDEPKLPSHAARELATDTYKDFLSRRDLVRAAVGPPRPRPNDRIILIGSADVHEYALSLLDDALTHLGAAFRNAGASVDPARFAELAVEHDAALVLVSTHNGMALGYAEQLLAELAFVRVAPMVAMGGMLNQDGAEANPSGAPVDVRAELSDLGVRVCEEVSDVAALMAEL